MNKRMAEKLKKTAYRTILIVDDLMKGMEAQEIVVKRGFDRNLIGYYKKLLTRKEK